MNNKPGRPPIHGESMREIHIYMPASVLEALAIEAASLGMSRARYIRQLLAAGYKASKSPLSSI